jgi:hypothetical protein
MSQPAPPPTLRDCPICGHPLARQIRPTNVLLYCPQPPEGCGGFDTVVERLWAR